MPHVLDEIASQPECWARAAEQAGQAEGLPAEGERVAIVGCGTSYNIACAYAALREASGHGESDAFAASELPPLRRYDRIIFLSRSGTTTEVLDALDRVPVGVATTAITGVPRAPIVALAQDVVTLEFADERSIVQTRFATSALVLLRAHLGEALEPLLSDAEQALATPLPPSYLNGSQFTFLGLGWTIGLAHEAALKLRESAHAWAESYSAMEFRHGPISVVDDRSLVWSLGVLPHGLAEDLEPTGALLVAASCDPLAELVRVQRLAVALAQAAGLDPDNPRYLSRSVILTAPN